MSLKFSECNEVEQRRHNSPLTTWFVRSFHTIIMVFHFHWPDMNKAEVSTLSVICFVHISLLFFPQGCWRCCERQGWIWIWWSEDSCGIPSRWTRRREVRWKRRLWGWWGPWTRPSTTPFWVPSLGIWTPSHWQLAGSQGPYARCWWCSVHWCL